MSDQSQISATVSVATKEKLDRFTESHGLKKNYVVEQALLYFMEARRELPDEALIPALERVGIPREDARDYTNDGCWEVIIPGRTDFRFQRLSAMLCLEWALNRGRSRLDGTQPGLVGDLAALLVGRRNGGAAGQRHAQRLGERVHGRRRAHGVAMADRGRRGGGDVDELVVIDAAGGQFFATGDAFEA